MFGTLGVPELAIIAVIVILLFGVGKVSGLGRELGSSIKEFRRAVKDEDETPNQAPPVQQSTQLPPPPPQQQYNQPPAQQQAPPPPPQQQSGETKNPNVF